MNKRPLPRLSDFLPLDANELAAIEGMTRETRRYRRHDIIRGQGEPARDVYFLAEGWVGSCVDVATGTRQMVKVHLAGDLLGTPSIVLSAAGETLVALNAVTVEVIPVSEFARLFQTGPRFATAMFLAAQKERVLLMDRLTSVARTTAVQRLAAFLLLTHDRLVKIEGLSEPSFDMPLSQEELSDVLGITPVHANRTFAQLDETGLVQRKGRRITISDMARLRSLSAAPERRFECAPEWGLSKPGSSWQAS